MEKKRRGPYRKRLVETKNVEDGSKLARKNYEMHVTESDLLKIHRPTFEITENDISHQKMEIIEADFLNDENILKTDDIVQEDCVIIPPTEGANVNIMHDGTQHIQQPTISEFSKDRVTLAYHLPNEGIIVDGDRPTEEHRNYEQDEDKIKSYQSETLIKNELHYFGVDTEKDEENYIYESDVDDFEFDDFIHNINAEFVDSDVEIDVASADVNIGSTDEELQPLFPGATVTIGAFMLLLALFVTKHSLVGDGIQQLLNIIALALPQGHRLCKSVHAFKIYFRNLKNPLAKHFYCSHCLGYIQDPRIRICPYAKCKKVLQNLDYFLEMPVKSQIRKLLTQKDFYLNLQGRFSSRKSGYKDIYDGKLYKKYFDFNGPLSNPDNISFTFNTDGAAVFKSSNVSVWPLFMVINELPYNIRMKKENMILAGLWFGNKKPAMGTYLQPFLDTFKELENGIEVSSPDKDLNFTLKGFLLCGTADLPARSLLCNSVQFNGSFSCWKCLQKGETAKVGKGHTHIFPYMEQPKEPARTIDSVIKDSKSSLDMQDSGVKKFAINGVKGPSWLTFFPKFDIIEGIAIDYMHGVLLGVQKLLLNLWFNVSNKGKVFNFNNKVQIVDERLLSIKPTSSISRLPRSISNDLKYWKASEYRAFLLYYGAPVLNGILNKERFIHYLLLVNAIYILLKSGSTEDDVNRAEIMLFEFVKMFSALYDKCYMTLNMHQLVHLADSVRSLGPLFTHSCFSFEDKNGVLLKMIKGTQNIDNQIITGVSFLQRLPELKQMTVVKGSEIEELCNSIENPNILSRGLKLAKNVYVLGAIKFKTLTDSEHRTVCQCLGYDPALSQYKYFKRLEFHDFLIYGTSYTRMTKRDNSCVCFKSNDDVILFGQVLFFILLDQNDAHTALAIICELQCKNYADDSNILHVQKLDRQIAIPIESIVESCVHVYFKDNAQFSYVCRIPNTMESD